MSNRGALAAGALLGVFVLTTTIIPLVVMGYAAISEVAAPVERVYQVQWGRVQCAQHDFTACGVTLSKCADANVYLCLTNVFYEDHEP